MNTTQTMTVTQSVFANAGGDLGIIVHLIRTYDPTPHVSLDTVANASRQIWATLPEQIPNKRGVNRRRRLPSYRDTGALLPGSLTVRPRGDV